jgi:hypothetical protein
MSLYGVKAAHVLIKSTALTFYRQFLPYAPRYPALAGRMASAAVHNKDPNLFTRHSINIK